MKNFLKEYKEFINKGDVIIVAVGLVMALYFKAIVDQLIAAVITPLIALIFGEASLDEIGFSISDTFFPIGLVFGAIIDFLAVALILFFVIKAYNRFKGPTVEEEAAVTEVDLLTEIRDQLRSQPARRETRVERRFNGHVIRRSALVPARARRASARWSASLLLAAVAGAMDDAERGRRCRAAAADATADRRRRRGAAIGRRADERERPRRASRGRSTRTERSPNSSVSRCIGNRVLVIGDSIMASTATRYTGYMCDELVPLGWAVEVEAEPSRFIDFGNVVLDKRLDPNAATTTTGTRRWSTSAATTATTRNGSRPSCG